MPNYRRASTPGATWFFTVNLRKRKDNDLLVREIATLRRCVAKERAARPFKINAWVVLPEHMHWIWTLPAGDADFATRWRRIKVEFSKRQGKTEKTPQRKLRRGERGIWQRRYWEHQIRDEDDYRRHVDYIHYNPVKHGHAQRAADRPHSSFRHYVDRGAYSEDWADGRSADVLGDD
jgi:putative transposase